MKNLLVGQSGGPTAVINGSLYGVLTESIRHPESIGRVYGMRNGIEGFLEGHYVDLTARLSEKEQQALLYTPGAFLGSCRYKLPEELTDPVYPRLFEAFLGMNIGYVLYIGGNDSMDTVSKLSRYAASVHSDIRFIGIPKTIDNDLVLTDHTPGFGSAAKYVASTVREICIDASVYHTESVTVVEIMGRNTGWLTAACALARRFENDNPVMIFLPETPFDQEAFLSGVSEQLRLRKNVTVCVSEGIRDKNGTFICEYSGAQGTDAFGHRMLTGCGKYLENLIRERLGIKVRSIELNVSQRCCSSSLSDTDLQEAVLAGKKGVLFALDKKTGVMVTFRRTAHSPYAITCQAEDVGNICNLEKTVPANWITEDGSDIKQELKDYLFPLIQGSVTIPMKDGLPDFAYLEDL
ncbi:MAG: 6-phosphofructokinase [Lachnospiraceae bacterium]|nr:6-phosphofructokinase [Lachnospiraceae bacterium]